MLAIIVAISHNRVIGLNGQIPWKVPGEQKFFKEVTMGHTLIMGSKTYQSIGHPLPGRKILVVSRSSCFDEEDVVTVSSLSQALEMVKDEDAFICGGGEIYRQTIDLADTLYITQMKFDVDGDVFFPEVNQDNYTISKISETEQYTINLYKRNG